MKRILVSTLAIMALSACSTTTPGYRNVAGARVVVDQDLNPLR